jgi:hypothetical protein
LLQSLEIIEKNMDKETEPRKSMRHKSHDERIKTRSVDKHYHHSPRHSIGKACSSSSPSLVREHKRRFGMNKINPPTFYGEHKKDGDAET